jgi:hypothetical protein
VFGVLRLQITILLIIQFVFSFFGLKYHKCELEEGRCVLAKEEEEHVCVVCLCVSILLCEERPDLGMKLNNNYS